MDLTSISPHLAMSNWGQRSGQNVEMMKYQPEYIVQWSACPLFYVNGVNVSGREVYFIWCSFTVGFRPLMYTAKANTKFLTLPLSWSVTDVVSIYLLVWVAAKCNSSATPLKVLKLNMRKSECSFTGTLPVWKCSLFVYTVKDWTNKTNNKTKTTLR